VVIFIISCLLQALFLGRYLNSWTTTYNLIQDSDSFQDPIEVNDLDLRFGFKTPANLLGR